MSDTHTPPAYFPRLIEILAGRLPQLRPEHTEVSPGIHCVTLMLDDVCRAHFGDADRAWAADVEILDEGEWWGANENISVGHVSFAGEPGEEQLQHLASKIVESAAEYVYGLMKYEAGERVTLVAEESRPPYFTAAPGSTGVIATLWPAQRIVRLDLDEPVVRTAPSRAPHSVESDNQVFFVGPAFYDFPFKIRRPPS
ncbi:MAG: hypothetical protein ACJ74Q_15125 [Pyrinomonadaceae bacterium]